MEKYERQSVETQVHLTHGKLNFMDALESPADASRITSAPKADCAQWARRLWLRLRRFSPPF